MNYIWLRNYINTLEYYKKEASSKIVSQKIWLILDQIAQHPITVEDLVMYIWSVPKFASIDDWDEFGEYIENSAMNVWDINFHNAVSFMLAWRNLRDCVFEPTLAPVPVITAWEIINIKNHFSINSFYEKTDEIDEDWMMVTWDQFIEYAEIWIDMKSYISEKISPMIFSKSLYSMYLILKEGDWAYEDETVVPYFRFMRSFGWNFMMPFVWYAELLQWLVDAQYSWLAQKDQLLVNKLLLDSYVARFIDWFESFLSDKRTWFFDRRLKAYWWMLHYFRS